MTAPGQRALAARFAGWLQARAPEDAALADGVAGVIPRLAQPADATPPAPSLPADDPTEARLRVLWQEFQADLPADWVDWSHGDDAVIWVDSAPDAGRARPAGPVPRLAAHAPETRARRKAPMAGLALLGLAFVLVAAPAMRSMFQAGALGADLADVAQSLRSENRAESAMFRRLVRQGHRADRLIATRQAQRQAVNLACEGEPECVERIAALDRSLRLARSVHEAALGDLGQAPLARLAQGSQSVRLPTAPPRVLLDERRDLAQQAAAPGLTPARRRVLDAEIAALDALLVPSPASP